jgi:hypothetical protein
VTTDVQAALAFLRELPLEERARIAAQLLTETDKRGPSGLGSDDPP